VTIHPAIAMLLVAASFAALIAGLRMLRNADAAGPEPLRKLLHVGMGVVSLMLPWFFDARWPVVLLAGAFGLCLSVGRTSAWWRRVTDGIIYGVQRASAGDLCFPAAVATAFLLSAGDRPNFCIPILTLTLADAAAALVGRRRGAHRFGSPGKEKSIEGSVAFCAVAVLCAYVPLRLWTAEHWIATLLLSLILAFLTTVVEALSRNGLDNLTVPLAAFLVLRTLRGCDATALMACLVVTGGTIACLAARCVRADRASSTASEVIHEPV
jgi:phytol kinase